LVNTKTACFAFGRMIDQEFHMIREPAFIHCKNVGAIKLWQASHNFQSRWIVCRATIRMRIRIASRGDAPLGDGCLIYFAPVFGAEEAGREDGRGFAAPGVLSMLTDGGPRMCLEKGPL
jgi:hypothetical protein